MRRWRKMTWAILVWTGAMSAWLIGYAVDTASKITETCGSGESLCRSVGEASMSTGILEIIGVGFMGFVVLSLVWFMSRPKPEQIVTVRNESS